METNALSVGRLCIKLKVAQPRWLIQAFSQRPQELRGMGHTSTQSVHGFPPWFEGLGKISCALRKRARENFQLR